METPGLAAVASPTLSALGNILRNSTRRKTFPHLLSLFFKVEDRTEGIEVSLGLHSTDLPHSLRIPLLKSFQLSHQFPQGRFLILGGKGQGQLSLSQGLFEVSHLLVELC